MNLIDFVRDLLHQPLFSSILSVIACICFFYFRDDNRKAKKFIWMVYAFVFSVSFLIFIGVLINRIHNPQIWDFTAFYLYGKVAVLGYDFYLPENMHIVFNTLKLPLLNYNEFVEEVVNTGFLYPPPTILLFAPLGLLSYENAIVAWTIFVLVFIPLSIYLLYDLFFKAFKLNGLMLVGSLFFLFSPVLSTIIFLQTNFILLFLLLLIIKYRDKKIIGLLLALAIFTKPFMVVFALVFILRKQWKTILYLIISSISIIGATVLLFGTRPFISYFFNNPVKRLPDWVFTEKINQSLHAVLLRADLITFDQSTSYTYISVCILLVTGFYLFYLLNKKLYDYIWVVLLLVGLLLYPGTLSYYGVMLLFVIFQFFDTKRQLGFNEKITIPIIGILFFLSSISIFIGISFILIVVVIKSLKLLFSKTYDLGVM